MQQRRPSSEKRRDRDLDEILYNPKKEKLSEKPLKKMSEEPFNEERPSSDILTEAIVHPTATGPIIIGALLVIYAFAFSWWTFGGFGVALILGLGGFITGAAFGFWRFVTGKGKYEEKVAKYMERKVESEEAADQARVESNIALLKTELPPIIRANGPFAETAQRGLKEVNDLIGARKIVLDETLQIKRDNRFSVDITARVEPLVKNVFSEGILLLVNLLSLIEAITSENKEVLAKEIRELEGDIAEGRCGEKLLGIKRDSLASKKKRLEKISANQESMELLLYRADECESVLRATQNDLIKIKIENSEDALDDVLHRLQNCVKVAIEVRQQLRSEGGLNL